MALINLRNAMMAGKHKPQPQMTFTINGSSFVSNASSLGLTTSDGSPVVVDWGDGTTTTSASGSSLGNHTYPSSGEWVASVFSEGTLTRIESRCFYNNASLVDISIPPTVVYLGNECLRQTGLTEFTFQRQFTYGTWPVWGDSGFRKLRFEGNFPPAALTSYDNYTNFTRLEFGPEVNDNNIWNNNGPLIRLISGGNVTTLVVDPANPYYEVRYGGDGVPQIVRKSDDCLIFIAVGLVGGYSWNGAGVNATVKSFTAGLTQLLDCTKFTVGEGVTAAGAHFCRDCARLVEVDLPSTLSSFSAWPLYNSPNITKITCRSQIPPSPLSSYGNYNTNAVVHVPAGCLAAYRAARFWSAFTTIVDDVQ